MNHPDEPLDPREEALVRALHAQAETVRPAGDGLVRIRARVERRRSRTRWVVPSASAAAVAATVTAVVASGVFTSGKQSSQLSIGAVSLTAATTPTAAVTPKAKRATAALAVPSPVATTAAVRTEATVLASPLAQTTTPFATRSTVSADNPTLTGPTPVWPFADSAAAATWQKSAPKNEAWHLDPVQTAEHFVGVLNLTGVTLAGTPTVTYADDKSSATVVLQRKGDAAAPVTLAGVALSHWGKGENAPWGVVSVASPFLNVTEAHATGPIQVSVTGSTEGQVAAKVYQAGKDTPIAKPTVSSTGTVTLAPAGAGGSGFVVLTNTSGGGSTPSVASLAVVPVQLTAGTPPSTTYAALVNGTIEVFDAASGAVIRTLAGGATGVASVAVTEDRQWAYYATTQGVMRTPYDGSGAPAVVSPDPATQVAVAGKHGEQLVYTYVSPDGQGQHLTWKSSAGLGTIQISQSLPPEAETLAVSPDGNEVASWVATGTEGAVNLFRLANPTASLSDATMVTACASPVTCAGATYSPDGDLVFATTDGTKITVYKDHLDQATQLFSVAASAKTVNLDVDATGTKVIMVAHGGSGWMWDGTKTTALPTGVTDASW